MTNGNVEILRVPGYISLQKTSFDTGSHFQIDQAGFGEHGLQSGFLYLSGTSSLAPQPWARAEGCSVFRHRLAVGSVCSKEGWCPNQSALPVALAFQKQWQLRRKQQISTYHWPEWAFLFLRLNWNICPIVNFKQCYQGIWQLIQEYSMVLLRRQKLESNSQNFPLYIVKWGGIGIISIDLGLVCVCECVHGHAYMCVHVHTFICVHAYACACITAPI